MIISLNHFEITFPWIWKIQAKHAISRVFLASLSLSNEKKHNGKPAELSNGQRQPVAEKTGPKEECGVL